MKKITGEQALIGATVVATVAGFIAGLVIQGHLPWLQAPGLLQRA
jgi:hypothetical protein